MKKNCLRALGPEMIAISLGILLTFAFAPYKIFPIAVLIPAGLLWLCLNASPKKSLRLGFLFGLGFFGVGVYWVYISIHYFGGVSVPLAVLVTAGLIAIQAAYPALTLYTLNRYFPYSHQAKILYAFPALWVFFEWLRSWVFTGFPWLLIGYSQTNSPLKGYAPILGVYGVSLAVFVSSGLLVLILTQLKRESLRSIYYPLIAFAAIWIAGGLLNLIPWTKPIGNPINVSLVQGGIPQQLKWSPEHLQLSLDRYRDLTQPLWGKSQLIIWPEGAIPLTLEEAAPYLEEMHQKALKTNTELVIGIPIQANANAYFNAVVTLGKTQQVYLKRHLVPFGEYTPFSDMFARLLNFMDVPMSDIVPGDMNQNPLVLNGTKVAASICFEIAFPELINTQDRDVGWLLTVTNDAWFGKSNAQAQHVQMAEMRAIELRRPVLIVSNDGITAFIGPDGHIKSQAPQYKDFVLTSTVQPTYGLTPWMRNRMDPILFILFCFTLVSIRANKKSRKIAVSIEHE